MKTHTQLYHEPHIFVNDEQLKATDSFTYLGSTLSREANIDVEVNNRLSKANSAFGRLMKKVWDRRGINQETKLKVYMAVMLTILLYACESWTVYSRHARKLNHFHTKCLRVILSIKWQDIIPDTTEVLTRAGIPSIHTLLQKAQVRWAGHVTRMPDDRLPKQLLYGSSAMENDQFVGKRNASRIPLRRPSQASTLMSPTGKSVPRIDHCGAVWFIMEQEQQKQTGSWRLRKSALLKARLYSTTSTSAGPTYARIGLISHLRNNRVNQTWHHHRRSYGHHRKRWTNNMKTHTQLNKKEDIVVCLAGEKIEEAMGPGKGVSLG